MSIGNKHYKVETYEGYKLSIEEVKGQIEDCPKCGAKLVIGHYADPENMIMQESARCVDCGHESCDKLHSLN